MKGWEGEGVGGRHIVYLFAPWRRQPSLQDWQDKTDYIIFSSVDVHKM